MPLETANTIGELDEQWPLGGEDLNRGDDHLRLIKFVLKSQFPGSLGNGFAKPITASEDEINRLSGVKSNIQDQIDALSTKGDTLEVNLSAPPGTRLVFYQAAAPTGWTLDTTNNDYMLRVVSSNGGGKGGTQSPVTANLDHVHATLGHALTPAESIHLRDFQMKAAGSPLGTADGTVGLPTDGAYSDYGYTGEYGSDARGNMRMRIKATCNAHSHGNTASTAVQFRPRYLNVIVATKD